MTKTIGFLIFLILLSDASAGENRIPVDCKVRAVFSSQGSLGEAILSEIRQAKSNLSVALYGFNNVVMCNELVKLAKQGVNVRVKVDESKTLSKKRGVTVVSILKDAGISVQTVGQERRNHNKFIVIDEAKVITGSYNWTLRAEQNWENILILDCPALAQKYEREWEEIR
jgi:phosphatidylserine/phosphatidylglycerophosphate/cardiolipin synthase-like enzyme